MTLLFIEKSEIRYDGTLDTNRWSAHPEVGRVEGAGEHNGDEERGEHDRD